jgi:hypothetical protein
MITCTRGLEEFLLEAGRPMDASIPPGLPTPAEIERVLTIAQRHGQVFPAAD